MKINWPWGHKKYVVKIYSFFDTQSGKPTKEVEIMARNSAEAFRKCKYLNKKAFEVMNVEADREGKDKTFAFLPLGEKFFIFAIAEPKKDEK